MYDGKVIEHYKNPKNVGSLEKENKSVGTGIVGAPECGDVMKLQVQVENNTVPTDLFSFSKEPTFLGVLIVFYYFSIIHSSFKLRLIKNLN